MHRLKTVWVVACVVTSATLVSSAQEPRPQDPRLREADTLMSGLRYEQAIEAYRQAQASDQARVRIHAGAGITRALLRMGRFEDAGVEAASVVSRDPAAASAIALHGDALWAAGLFDEAENRYAAALQIDPDDPGALHGRARALAAQYRLNDALDLALRATTLAPDQPEYFYTLASIHEQRRDFASAVAVLDQYLRLLPPADQTHLARWARGQQQFLRSFGRRTPVEVVSKDASYTLPIRIVGGRVLVDGSINGRTAVEFALDTGTDLTILTPAIANRANITSTVTVQSAGVGSLGLGYRDLELARIEEMKIGSLRIRHVPSVVKAPALMGLPRPEGAGFSPLALGYSMILDYSTERLTIARQLPPMTHAVTLPLRVHRLPIVRVMVNDTMPAGFAIDTAGDANALSLRMSRRIDVSSDLRLAAARVYGSAGVDPGAFLLPFVRLNLAPGVGTAGQSIVVLNLDAPSGLLGVNLGGIIGHEFLRKYRLTIDLVRSEVGLDPIR